MDVAAQSNQDLTGIQLTTAELAFWLGMKKGSIYNAVSNSGGTFWQIEPRKTPAGRLMWDAQHFCKYAQCPIENILSRRAP